MAMPCRRICLFIALLYCALSAWQPLAAQQALDKDWRYGLRKVFHSELYQGHKKQSGYYEGWYFKLVAPDGGHVFSLIPGIALGARDVQDHAFIQLINGKTGKTAYHRFPASDFRYSCKNFYVEIGGNQFLSTGLKVDIGEGAERFQAEITFEGQSGIPAWLGSPSIMGWYRYAPFMETYHGLVSMDHVLHGQASYGGVPIDYEGGRGYTEKDWGHTMPRSWIWMQSNDFAEPGVSFMASIATVPWLNKEFRGFLGFLLVKGRVYRFATYTGAKLLGLRMEEKELSFTIAEGQFSIAVRALRSRAGYLQAPVLGAMDRRIAESIDATIGLTLRDRKGRVIFQGEGSQAGLEVVGDPADLLAE
jgi:tocopherol cyclase